MNSGRIRHICLGRNLSSVVKHALYLAGFEEYAREREKTRAGTLFVFCRTQFSVLHIACLVRRILCGSFCDLKERSFQSV